ncbi:Rhodanese/sulfurtransferase-like protein [Candidatus Koribacter versatilis Ellin345]|uniref:Rhodanese/sulfurtransferase-like protein n=1 Tax=Koribacter versatilis (strain Ellin345) TaxID=204669 RepID=Q1IPB7_KORVE|nr:rhodanese-like domain-containing protein [Candidatus Koribacter versatilis]ABF41283.1 Rhodanese/sulfurtransferase-like protein [Candidatus Koribacter versatilis Ellin345]
MSKSLEYEIQPEEVKPLLGTEGVVLVDVREPWERDTAKIEDTLFIPMGDIPARIQELDPDDHVIVVCHHGVRSLSVAAWLRQQGYEKAQSMAGGIDRWSRFIDPKVPLY